MILIHVKIKCCIFNITIKGFEYLDFVYEKSWCKVFVVGMKTFPRKNVSILVFGWFFEFASYKKSQLFFNIPYRY